jgi:hypothetical protein
MTNQDIITQADVQEVRQGVTDIRQALGRIEGDLDRIAERLSALDAKTAVSE